MKSKEELLEELCISQFHTLNFLNKVMFETVKHQRSLSETEQNSELLNFAWETNDIIVDHPREWEIDTLLREHYNFDIRTNKY